MLDHGTDATTRVLDLLDALPIMILDVDERGMVQFANKRVRDRIGLPTDLDDTSLADILDESCRADATAQLSELFNGENDITSTWKLRTRNGGAVQVDTNAVTIYDNGNPFRVRFYLHDGSDLGAAMPAAGLAAGSADLKAALKEEQEYTKALIQKSGLLVYILDTKNNVVEVNKKMEEVTGFSREMTPTLDALLAGLYPDGKYRNIVERIHQNMYKNQHIRETELSITTRSNEVKHISWSTARLKNARGQVHGFIAMGTEVSEKKRLEQWVKLQSSCFDRVSDAVVVSDLKGQIINWVGGAERMLGYSARDMVGKPVADLYPQEYRNEISAALNEAIERDGKWSSEMVMTTADGRKLAVRFDAAVILNEKGAPIALVSVIHDQTREKQYEKEMAEDREELGELGRLIERREQEVRDAQAHIEEIERRVEYFATKNRDLEQEANRFASGRVVLESAIKELQIFQLQVLGVSSAALLTIDPAGIVTNWSRGAEELVGIPENKASQRHHDEVFKLEEFDWELIQAEALQKGKVVLPCTLIRDDGSKQQILLETSVLKDEQGQPIGFTEVAMPPTAGNAQNLDQELLEARNLATVGELTVGIARDLGDAFSALNANLQRLHGYTDDLKKVVELYRNGVSHRDIEAFARRVDLKSILNDLDFLFDESSEGLVRIRNLARDLESYLPDSADVGEVLRLNELADSAVSLVRADLQNRCRIEKVYHDALLIAGNRNAALRAFIHLLMSGLRAFEHANTGKNELRIKTGLDGEQAVIEITHNGAQVGDDILGHLNDLTWLAGRPGSIPLNLGMASQLIASLKGSLKVSSTDGATTFKVTLPAVDGDAGAIPTDEEERAEPRANVLFIDDEKNQLRSYRRYFERYYHVFQADSADEALNALSVRQDFGAVVMDLLLPEAEGLQLHTQLAERYQQLADRVVFLVPPGLSLATRDALLKTGRIVLHKPIEMESLATILAHLTR